MIHSASLFLRSFLLISIALSSISPAWGMDPKKLRGDLSSSDPSSPSTSSSSTSSSSSDAVDDLADELAAEHIALVPINVKQSALKTAVINVAEKFFEHVNDNHNPAHTNYDTGNEEVTTLNTPHDGSVLAEHVRRPQAPATRPFLGIITLPYTYQGEVRKLRRIYLYSNNCQQTEIKAISPTLVTNKQKYSAPSNLKRWPSKRASQHHISGPAHNLNYVVTHNKDEYDRVKASLGKYFENDSGLTISYLDILKMIGTNITDILSFARNVIRLLKHTDEKKPLTGSQSIKEASLHFASLVLTTERLRHEKALDETYTQFYILKHAPTLALLIQLLNKKYSNSLTFVHSPDTLRAESPVTLVNQLKAMHKAKQETFKVAHEHEEYVRKVSQSAFFAKKLAKLQHIHGTLPDTHGYILQANGLAPTAFGTHLPPNAQQFPNIPANYTHIFTSGVANACLFNAVAVANAAATGQSQAQQAALASRGGRAARHEAAAKMKAKLKQEQANLTPSAMVELLLEDLSHYLEGHPTQVQSLWNALLAAAGEGNAALNPPVNPTAETINTFLADTLDTGGNSPWLFALLQAYIQEIEDRETMEGTTMINLLAHAYGHPITLHAPLANMGFEGTYGQTQAAPTLHIYITNYMGANVTSANDLNHYNALIPPPAEAPVPLTQIPAQVATTTLAAPTPATQASAQVVTMPIAPVLAAQAPAQPAKKPTHLLRFTSM